MEASNAISKEAGEAPTGKTSFGIGPDNDAASRTEITSPADSLGDAGRRRPRVLVVAGEFGWGSAGKLQMVLEQLPVIDVLVLGSILGGDLLGGRPRQARDVPSTVAETRRLVEAHDVAAALVVGEPVAAQRLVEAGCPTVFLDSLPFLWTENDPVATCADTYCAQRSVPEPAWDILHRARRLVWVESVVPTISGSSAANGASTQRHGVVINMGGLHSPFSGDSGHHYLRAVLPPVLRAADKHGLDVKAVCGNLSDDDIDWVRGEAPRLAHVGPARPDRFDALVRTAELLITSPGSTTLLQANQASTPVITLPPQNLSQVINAEWFNRDRPDSAVGWPETLADPEAFDALREKGEEAAMVFLYEAIASAANDTVLQEAMEQQVGDLLEGLDSIPHSRAHVDRLGHQGAQQVASEVLRLVDRGPDRVLRERSPQLRIYVGGPFQARLVDGELKVDDEYRALYEDLIDCFEDRGWHVFNAHRREAWGAQMLPARTLTSMDYQDVSCCDVFVATPGADPMSPGTHIEIGWASALGKRIFLLTEHGRDYAALVTGLPAVSDVTFVPFMMGGPVGTEVSDLIEQAANRPCGQCSEDAD